jgi:ubiquinone/menaquinone biosynthesis C-methylase UbiE
LRQNEWANPATLNPDAVAGMVVHLENRSRAPDQRLVNAYLVETLNPQPGEVIVEVGSGSGVLCRLAAPKLAPYGKLVGIDISHEICRAALHHSREVDLIHLNPFVAGAAEKLPFADEIFHGALAARLLLHVLHPVSVVKEMARVVKPSGRVVLMDWDFDTVVIHHSNRDLTRRILHWRTDHVGGDNWSGRKLFSYLSSAGLSDLRLHPLVSLAYSQDDSLCQSIFKAAHAARDSGVISDQEHVSWLEEIQQLLASGSFFASIVYFIACGVKKAA